MLRSAFSKVLFPILEINLSNIIGAEENIVARNNKDNERVRTTSTTIAEEAVDQLQASEKLIAGKFW